MTPLDAELAVEAGAAGIVVSNHGGRVLEPPPGAAEVLPAIARAWASGWGPGRRGGAFGGRPCSSSWPWAPGRSWWGGPLAVGGHRRRGGGVATHLAMLRASFLSAMVLTGCANLKAVGPEIIIRREA